MRKLLPLLVPAVIALSARGDTAQALERTVRNAKQVAETAEAVAPVKAEPPPAVCSAGRLQPVQFGATEQLAFKLDAFGADIGTLELRAGPPSAEDRGRGAVLVQARGKTSDLISTNVRRVEGWSSALIAAGGAPVRYREEVDEGGLHRAQDIQFPAKDGALWVRATRNGDPDPLALQATSDARDLLSGLFVLRRQALTPGAELCAEIYAARRMWRVQGKMAAKVETVEGPLGRFQTMRLDAVATRLDDPRITRKAHVWLTTDDRRLPVVILGDVRGRFVRATLTEAKVGRTRLRRTASR